MLSKSFIWQPVNQIRGGEMDEDTGEPKLSHIVSELFYPILGTVYCSV
jgi:hypothetical protein